MDREEENKLIAKANILQFLTRKYNALVKEKAKTPKDENAIYVKYKDYTFESIQEIDEVYGYGDITPQVCEFLKKELESKIHNKYIDNERRVIDIELIILKNYIDNLKWELGK